MPESVNKIFCFAMVLLISSVSAVAKDNHRPAAVSGTRVRQLMLKKALEKYISGTLVEELNRNKKLWASMSPEELRRLRSRYYAFLKENPAKQAELINAAEKFQKLTDEQRRAYIKRAEWLKKVVSHLTDEQKQALKKLPPAQRAKRLLELKAIYCASQPATLPAKQGTTRRVPATNPSPTTQPTTKPHQIGSEED